MTKNRVVIMWAMWRCIRDMLKIFHSELQKDKHYDMAQRLDSWQSTVVDNMWANYNERSENDQILEHKLCEHGNDVDGHCDQCDQYEFNFTNR